MRPLFAAMIALMAQISVQAQAGLDWETALEGDQRSAEHRARDQYRHPRETLEFFGIQSGMTVVEISPGGSGWYTEILAPLLKGNGTLYAAHSALNPPHPYYRRSLGSFLQKLGENNDVYGEVIVTQLQPPMVIDSAPAGSADLVVSFRNLHGWINSGILEPVVAEAHRALKPGGILGVVQHRAKPGTSLADMKASGYVTESHAIKTIEAAGFELVEKSEVNANPNDSADHPEGVWTLPPQLRLGDKNRDQYLAIGESDRMTLKFRRR